MIRRATTTVLLAFGAGSSACEHTPTEPALNRAPDAPAAATLRWAATRLVDRSGEATAINGKGEVVGFYSAPNGTPGFLWSNGTRRNLGTLGGTNTRPLAINESTQIVGQSSIPGGNWHAFLWVNGTMQDLGTLDGVESAATSIENGGRIVGYTDHADGRRRAFIYENGTMKRLAGLNQQFSIATDIDQMGRVVGYHGTPARAFRWVAGKVTDLGTLGGPGAQATAMSGNRVVGHATTSAELGEAFIWQNGSMTSLGKLPGHNNSGAMGISGQGHVTGWSQVSGITPRAFLWKDGVMSDIGIGEGNGVNREGWIVGTQISYPVLWRPTTAPPPPASVTLGTSFFFSERNGTINPAVDTVPVGNSLTWTWISGPAVSHNVQSVGTPSFPSSPLTGGVGVTHTVKFTKKGVYLYNCRAHPGNMKGRVVVR